MTDESLIALAARHFERRGYSVERGITIIGVSGLPQAFDLALTKGDERVLVNVMDWARSVGVNMVMKLDRAAEDVGVRKAVLVARVFSGHAYSYSHLHGVELLTPRELR